jgi:hypothetical protein
MNHPQRQVQERFREYMNTAGGKRQFSVEILETLIMAGHQFCLAVTQPDK